MTSRSLRIAGDMIKEDAILNSSITISNAASLFRRKVVADQNAYTTDVIKCNNAIVDEWYDKVLVGVADKDNALPSGRVSSCLSYFIEGKELQRYQKYKKYLPDYPEDKVLFWIDVLKRLTIQELMNEFGPAMIGAAWNMITTAMRYDLASKKWDVIYGNTSDPLAWDKLANKHPHLMKGRPMPFDISPDTFDIMRDKVTAILANPIEPQK